MTHVDSATSTSCCTMCAQRSPVLVPWSRERLCMDCADLQLDLLAKALPAPVSYNAEPVIDLVLGTDGVWAVAA